MVYGHRRLQACRQLGLPVLAMVDNIDDRALFAEMERENRGRQNLSPWEQGVMYRRALDEGLFASMRQMAEMLGANVSAVSRSLALANLPQEVVSAFSSPLELQFRWAKLLTDAIERDRDGVLRRAREARTWPAGRLAPKVLAHLTSGASAQRESNATSQGRAWALRKGAVTLATVSTSPEGVRVQWHTSNPDDPVLERCLEALRVALGADSTEGV